MLDSDQLQLLLSQALSDNMLFFQRSFSALFIALFFCAITGSNFLKKEAFEPITRRLADYCAQEKDYRSFVVAKGWAHAPAHISDALDECVRSRYAGFVACRNIWTGLFDLLNQAPQVFGAEEDERIATPVIAMIELKKITAADLFSWLQIDTVRAAMIRRINFKHFVRFLFMRMKERALLEKEEELRLFQLEHRFNINFCHL